jgi:hypothetical protein
MSWKEMPLNQFPMWLPIHRAIPRVEGFKCPPLLNSELLLLEGEHHGEQEQ